MTYVEEEYEELGLAARWLTKERARNAYTYALQFSSDNRYGLNELTTGDIENHVVQSLGVTGAWLKTRLRAEGTLQVVYGPDDVCVVDAASFLNCWQQVFVPSRDDAIVLHNADKTVFFYYHEDELEVGIRKF